MTLQLDSYRPEPPAPTDVDSERMLLGNVISGDLDPGVLDALAIEDLWVPLHRWVLAQIRSGARTLDELVECATQEGVQRAALAIDALTEEPLQLWPPVAQRVESIAHQARKRRALDALDACKLAILSDDTDALEASRECIGELVPSLKTLMTDAANYP